MDSIKAIIYSRIPHKIPLNKVQNRKNKSSGFFNAWRNRTTERAPIIPKNTKILECMVIMRVVDITPIPGRKSQVELPRQEIYSRELS